MKSTIKKALKTVVHGLKAYEGKKDIKEQEFWEIYRFCKPYTMTSYERMYALYKSVEYVLSNNIEGDFVECGVWRGGSSMLVAKMLSARNITDRKIYLYDTFEGMSEPTAEDVDNKNRSADQMLKKGIGDKEESVWCLASLQDVKENLALTSISSDLLVFVEGKVEETLRVTLPENISLLRLDTDWYESTRQELLYLFPRLATNGVLIIDDYGHWEGCRKAVDEYLAENNINMLLNRIDYTGRIALKTSSAIGG